jgi:hypothetical protein
VPKNNLQVACVVSRALPQRCRRAERPGATPQSRERLKARRDDLRHLL